MDTRPAGTTPRSPELDAALGSAFDRLSIAMVVTRLTDGTYLAVNDAFVQTSGYERDEMIGKPSTEIARWKYPEERKAFADALRASGSVEGRHGRFLTKKGETRDASFTAVVTTWDGEPAVLTLARDITDEDQERASERLTSEWLRAIFDSAFDGMVIHQGGIVVQANQAFADVFGYEDPSTVIGMRVPEDFAASEYWATIEMAVASRSAEPYITEGFRHDGTRVTTELAGRSITYEGKPARVAFVRDMTDLLDAQAAVEEANKRYRTIVDNVPAVTYTWHSSGMKGYGVTNFISPQVERLFGYTQEAWLADPALWYRSVNAEDAQDVLESWRTASERGEPFRAEYRITTKAGAVRWIRDEARPVRFDESGNPQWQGVMYDITEEALQRQETLRRDELLAESEERFRTLVEEIPAVTFIEEWIDPATGDADAFGNPLRYVSPQFEAVTGLSREQRTQDPMAWRDMLHEDDRERIAALDVTSSRNGDPFRAEYRIVKPDGAEVWLREDTRLVRNPEGQPLFWLGVQFDITEGKRTAEELDVSLQDLRRADAQRRDLLAKLVTAQEEERRRIASDIHDDSIQKLAAIGLRLETLRARIDDSKALGIIDRIDETVATSINRLRHLMFELWPPALERHGLGAAIRTELDQATAGTGIAVEIDDDDLEGALAPEIRTIAYRIAQEAIGNIVKHADATTIRVQISERDEGLRLRITDDGKGVVAEPASPPGHVGLSAMRERAQMAGGTIAISAGRDGGTVVECWLPGAKG